MRSNPQIKVRARNITSEKAVIDYRHRRLGKSGHIVKAPARVVISFQEYLAAKLRINGISHVFGVPGHTTLEFWQHLEEKCQSISPINLVSERAAGFAADGYARINGAAAVLVTWNVGGFGVMDPIAGAYAERLPILVISGGPGRDFERADRRPPHFVGRFDAQLHAFAQITRLAMRIDNPQTAAERLDEAFSVMYESRRPVYVEIAADLWGESIEAGAFLVPTTEVAKPHILCKRKCAEAVLAATRMLEDAGDPFIIAGPELADRQLIAEVDRLVESTNYPVAATLRGKSVYPERSPHYLGVFQGPLSHEPVKNRLEKSDCALILGAELVDIDFSQIPQDHQIQAADGCVRVGSQIFEGIGLKDFVCGLLSMGLRGLSRNHHSYRIGNWIPRINRSITTTRLMHAVNSILTPDTIVISDVGTSLFAAKDLQTARPRSFVTTAHYLSLGYAIPAAIGAELAHRRQNGNGSRAVVIVGDGAFQMTGTTLSLSKALGCNPIVILLNNRGYTTERLHTDGDFNDLPNWQYHRLPHVFGHGRSYVVESELHLHEALMKAVKDRSGYSLLDVRLRPTDAGRTLIQLWSEMTKKGVPSAECGVSGTEC